MPGPPCAVQLGRRGRRSGHGTLAGRVVGQGDTVCTNPSSTRPSARAHPPWPLPGGRVIGRDVKAVSSRGKASSALPDTSAMPAPPRSRWGSAASWTSSSRLRGNARGIGSGWPVGGLGRGTSVFVLVISGNAMIGRRDMGVVGGAGPRHVAGGAVVAAVAFQSGPSPGGCIPDRHGTPGNDPDSTPPSPPARLDVRIVTRDAPEPALARTEATALVHLLDLAAKSIVARTGEGSRTSTRSDRTATRADSLHREDRREPSAVGRSSGIVRRRHRGARARASPG